MFTLLSPAIRAGSVWLVSAALLTLAALSPQPAAAEVKWRSGERGAPSRMQPAQLDTAIKQLAKRNGQSRVVIHFDGPLSPARREALEAGGVHLMNYLGGYAFFANLSRDVDSARAAAVEGLVAIEPIKAANKLHADLARGMVYPWAIVPAPAGAGGGEDDAGQAGEKLDQTVAVYVLFHRDVDLMREAPGVVARHNGEIPSYIHSINGVVAHLPMSRVQALAAEDAVMWVEPPLPLLTEINDSNRARVGADTLQQPPYGLDGTGVQVLVYDGGRAASHGDLAGRLTVGQSDTSSTSDHATHVSCTVGGDGAGSGGTNRGMAPGVDIISYGFEQEGGLQQGFLYTDPGDLEADYTEAITVYGADVSNNSIGTNTASNGFPCEWEGNYGATGVLIDSIVRGAVGDPFRIVWSNGNERGSGACGSTYHTTAPPACAKNHTTIGALNSNDDSVTSFTSWGPCDDGRLKPDVSGPGCQSNGDSGVTSCSSSGGYTVKCGTSMSGPTVAGVAALLLQQYRQSFPTEPDPRNSTLKAILAQTCEDIENPGPDFKTGYGSVRGVPAVDLIAQERFLQAEVGQGEVYAFLVLVDPGATELKVTLAWDDAPGTPDVNPVLVNDLDLRVIGGGTHLPWTLDPDNPSAPAVKMQADHVNNIEQVVVDNPVPGAYTIEVEGFNIADGPTQPFSVAASSTVINCSSAGLVTTNASRISCSANLGMKVIDCDLNTDDGQTETVDVDITSNTEPGGETITLVESAPESAAFEGSITVDTTDSAGVLHVADGDTVSVTYIDADDGEGGINVPVTRDVTVDCAPPVITSVTVTDVQPRDATVAITANEPVKITVSYGTSCGNLTDTASSAALSMTHELTLDPLVDDTTYFFTVEGEDEAGNVAVDDNGGACYTFTTPEIPDFFSEQFESIPDLEGLVLTFTPNGTFDFYSACVESLGGALPTDPAGGTDLGLPDDQPGSFTLGGGAEVSLYGQNHSTVHVGPNGYVTFGSGDSDYTETFGDHFSLPRIAALWDDLNPSTGGTVSWKQLPDRVAVTWEDVPEYGNATALNTFQIEMFFNGDIRLSWLAIDVDNALAGLSEGAGLDPDFYESDLSAYGACGPRPPTVQDIQVETNISDPVSIALSANDDGLPEPPSLTYRITGLPAFGSLSDNGNGAPIDAVPYDLIFGGNAVTYDPNPGYEGADSFTYRADDGGTPPEGGESGTATVDINVTVGGPETLYEYLVDDTDPGWSTTGDWTFGQPTGGGSHSGDPTEGATDDNVYGYNLNGDYPDNLGEEYLTTDPINLSFAENTSIEFRRWLGVEGSFHDHARFEASTNGTDWTTIWNHSGLAVNESSWSLQSYDISTIAEHEAAVRFRWVMGTTDANVTYPGWNIDDVRIVGVVDPICTEPPAEVSNVIFSGTQTLEWASGISFGQDPPVYDTLRTTGSLDFEASAVCVETDDGSDTAATDTEDPESGGVFYYLIRAENGCGMGPLGASSSGTDRVGIDCTTP